MIHLHESGCNLASEAAVEMHSIRRAKTVKGPLQMQLPLSPKTAAGSDAADGKIQSKRSLHGFWHCFA